MRKFFTLLLLVSSFFVLSYARAQALSVDVVVFPQQLYPGNEGYIKVTLLIKERKL